MTFKLSAIAIAAAALSAAAAQAADFPTTDTTYNEDVVLPGYGDINTDLTISGNGTNHLTIRDDLERQGQATISVTGGVTTFKNFDTFTLHADHTGFGGGYAVQGLYVLHGGKIAFDQIKHIALGTDEEPLVNTYTVTAHSGEVSFTNFETFSVRSSNGLWATNSGGSGSIVVDGGTTGTIDIKTDSFALDADTWDYADGYKDSVGIRLKGQSVSLESTNSRAIILGSGIEGADSSIAIEAADDVLIKGKTNGVEITRYAADGGANTLDIKAGNAIRIEAEEAALVELNSAAGTAVNLTAPAIEVEGDIHLAQSTLALSTGAQDEAAVNFHLVDGDLLVNELNAAHDVNITAEFNEKLGEFNIAGGTRGATSATVTGMAARHLSEEEGLAYLEAQNLGNTSSLTLENAAWEMTKTTNENGETSVKREAGELSQSSMDIAALTMIAWRNETTTITDRMASLRTNPKDIGAWVRWNGGEYQYDDREISNDFNTIEVGVDTQVAPQWTIGASFSYTQGDGDYVAGSTESDTYAGALYALWHHEKGSFVDVVAKAGQLSTDFDFRGLAGTAVEKGELDQTGFIFGVETGHRFSLPMNTFVEPQIQLTYSSLGNDSTTTSVRHIDVESTESLVGRIGLMAGISCPENRGSAYVRASVLHDFMGDVEGSFRDVANPDSITLEESLDGTWAEFAIGADFKVTDNAYVFADVAKSTGGDIDLDWRANVGAKFVW